MCVLRSFLPIWLYVFPVIGAAALASLIFALFDEEDPSYLMKRTQPEESVFGFLSKEYCLYALYLGVGPGICGHTMLNTLFKLCVPSHHIYCNVIGTYSWKYPRVLLGTAASSRVIYKGWCPFKDSPKSSLPTWWRCTAYWIGFSGGG